ILDANSVQVAIDDNSAGDGRNALITYVAPTAGTYYVEVSSTTASTTVGDYVLSLSGNTATNGAFAVSASTPANGAALNVAPTQVTIDFNDSVLATTLAASDLTVDGVAATAVTLLDNNTAIFTIAAPSSGPHTANIAAGSIQDIQATSIQAFSATFTLDTIAPRVVSSSLQQNQSSAPGALIYTAVFDKAMNKTNLDVSDFSLLGVFKNVSYAPSVFSYSADGKTLTISYASLPEDRYTLTLLSADGRFEDPSGNDLDGEANFPIPPNKSGDGVAGGNFIVNFSTDVATQAYPTPLASK